MDQFVYFQSGDRVEVCSKDDGYQGSYYAATVLSSKYGSYVVQYDKLVEEKDEITPLQEVVSAHEVRPMPPRRPLPTANGGFTEVDAFDNDGWWVGKITGKKGSKFLVYFDLCGVETAYRIDELRIHQEWINGKWIVSEKRALGI